MACSADSSESEGDACKGNYTDWNITRNLQDGEDKLPDIHFDDSVIWLTMGQVERGDDTSRKHYQVFVQFIEKKTLQRAKAALKLGPSTHLERRWGTVQEAVKYVHKDETW